MGGKEPFRPTPLLGKGISNLGWGFQMVAASFSYQSYVFFLALNLNFDLLLGPFSILGNALQGLSSPIAAAPRNSFFSASLLFLRQYS